MSETFVARNRCSQVGASGGRSGCKVTHWRATPRRGRRPDRRWRSSNRCSRPRLSRPRSPARRARTIRCLTRPTSQTPTRSRRQLPTRPALLFPSASRSEPRCCRRPHRLPTRSSHSINPRLACLRMRAISAASTSTARSCAIARASSISRCGRAPHRLRDRARRGRHRVAGLAARRRRRAAVVATELGCADGRAPDFGTLISLELGFEA